MKIYKIYKNKYNIDVILTTNIPGYFIKYSAY